MTGFPPEHAPARPKPSDRKKERQRTKNNHNQPIDDEASEPGGPARAKRSPQDLLLITFDGIADEDGVGAFQSGRPHRVNLSKDDPYVAQLMEHRDQRLAEYTLYAIAIALFEQGRESAQGDLFIDPFGKRIAKMLALQNSGHASIIGRTA